MIKAENVPIMSLQAQQAEILFKWINALSA